MNAVVVTGGANGIGAAVVDRLTSAGHQVGVLDVEEPRNRAAAQTAEGGQARFLSCDVTDERQVRSAIERVAGEFGPLSAAVHCAGKDTYGDSLETTSEEFDAAIDLNLRSVWLVAKNAAHHMATQGGSIVLIASVHSYQTRAQRFPYPVAKAGVLGLTRSLALDLADRNIRVNAVCPGFVRTRLLESALADADEPAAMLARIERSQPLGRVGEPEDIAGVVHFLITGEAAYITGTSIVVDGGMTAMLPG